MNGFAAPVTAVTADGRLVGVGATVYGAVGADNLIGGAVTALLYDTPMDSGAAWVAVGTADGAYQFPAAAVFADRARCLEDARRACRQRMTAARRELEQSTDEYQRLSQGAA